MISVLKDRKAGIEWINNLTDQHKKFSVLVPQYNEARNNGFIKRLDHFRKMAELHRSWLDIVLVDDGSDDYNLEMINNYLEKYPAAFSVASVTPNSRKVGALFLATAEVSHEYIILTDFDTDLANIDSMLLHYQVMAGDPSVIGWYFRMLPYDGKGFVYKMQELEYAFARMYYRFHRADHSVPVMPGAGCCFRRKTLLDIYHQHSGLMNGEDREATMIGIKMGYKVLYKNDVLALTRTPQDFMTLLRQRKRWYLGYLETFVKEKNFYLDQLKKGKWVGIRVLLDITGITLLLLMPLIMLVMAVASPISLVYLLLLYPLSLVYYISLLLMNKTESREIPVTDKLLVLMYPLFWVVLSYLAWVRAMKALAAKKKGPENVSMVIGNVSGERIRS